MDKKCAKQYYAQSVTLFSLVPCFDPFDHSNDIIQNAAPWDAVRAYLRKGNCFLGGNSRTFLFIPQSLQKKFVEYHLAGQHAAATNFPYNRKQSEIVDMILDILNDMILY